MNNFVRALLRFGSWLTFLVFVTVSGIAQFTPAPGSPFTVDTISGFLTGDFNGDGQEDVVVVNTTTASPGVSVLLGNGKGGFRDAPDKSFPVRSGSVAAAIDDFDRDGKLDLVIVNSSDHDITVLLGNGRGGFRTAPGSPFSAGTWLGAVATGDFNGDGKPDLAIANNTSNNFSIPSTGANSVILMPGDGMGSFHAPTGNPVAVGTLYVTSLATGDFNGDGKQDLAVGFLHNHVPLVLTGNGSGGLSAPGYPGAEAISCGVTSIAVADFNKDGRLDVAAACNGHVGFLSVLPGDGLGGFTTSSYALLGEPHTVSVGDFNGDGNADLAVLQTGPVVTVLFGAGSGTFSEAPGSPYAVGSPSGLGNGGIAAVGDFNRDDKADIVAWNPQGSSLTVLLNSSPRSFGIVQ